MHITARRALNPATLALPLSVATILLHGREWFAGAVADATIDAHRLRQAELIAASEAVIATADAERRELSLEERATITGNAAEVDRLDGEVQLRERIIAQSGRLAESRGRQTAPERTEGDEAADPAEPPARPTNRAERQAPLAPVPARPATGAGTQGFRNFGDFAVAVRRGSIRGGEVDRRLMNAAASSITQESVGADGGFAVPPDFRADIMQRTFSEDSLMGRCDLQNASGNNWSAPVDETTPWGTGGVKAYWESEAAAISQSKVQLRDVNLRLHKLASLVPVTEEMLEDASAMDGYLRSKLPEALDWSASMGITWGTGVGQPLGFMRSAALVTVAAEGAQAADTIVAENVANMYARMPRRSRPTAVWLIHADAEPKLFTMKVGDSPVYMPPGGLSAAPYGTLMGRPVIPHEVCETIGDVGDIMFVDLKQYLLVRKAGGIRVQTSMHLWFDQDIQAFKATLRVAGQPWWSAPMAHRDGSNDASPFIALAAR